VFSTKIRDGLGGTSCLALFQASSVAITRHIKIQAEATPYDPAFTDYFTRRAQSRRVNHLMWRGMVAFPRSCIRFCINEASGRVTTALVRHEPCEGNHHARFLEGREWATIPGYSSPDRVKSDRF
jgi:hypothetical protein